MQTNKFQKKFRYITSYSDSMIKYSKARNRERERKIKHNNKNNIYRKIEEMTKHAERKKKNNDQGKMKMKKERKQEF